VLLFLKVCNLFEHYFLVLVQFILDFIFYLLYILVPKISPAQPALYAHVNSHEQEEALSTHPQSVAKCRQKAPVTGKKKKLHFIAMDI